MSPTRSRTQLAATLCPTCTQDGSSATGGHASTETMLACSLEVVGLEGALHRSLLEVGRPRRRSSRTRAIRLDRRRGRWAAWAARTTSRQNTYSAEHIPCGQCQPKKSCLGVGIDQSHSDQGHMTAIRGLPPGCGITKDARPSQTRLCLLDTRDNQPFPQVRVRPAMPPATVR